MASYIDLLDFISMNTPLGPNRRNGFTAVEDVDYEDLSEPTQTSPQQEPEVIEFDEDDAQLTDE